MDKLNLLKKIAMDNSSPVQENKAGFVSGLTRNAIGDIIKITEKMPGGLNYENLFKTVFEKIKDKKEINMALNDVLGHVVMEKHGIKTYKNPIDQALATAEALNIPKGKLHLAASTGKDFDPFNVSPDLNGSIGSFNRDKQIVSQSISPEHTAPESIAGVMTHENEHLNDLLTSNFNSEPYDFGSIWNPNSNINRLKNTQNVDEVRKIIESLTKNHFGSYPNKSFETQKAIELLTNTVPETKPVIKSKNYQTMEDLLNNKLKNIEKSKLNKQTERLNSIDPDNSLTYPEVSLIPIENRFDKIKELWEQKGKPIQDKLEETRSSTVPKEELYSDAKKAAAIVPTMGASEFDLKKPAKQIADIYNQYIKKPINNISNTVADKVVKTTSLSPQADETSKALVSGGLKMALDPINYVDPLIGIPASFAVEKYVTPEESEDDTRHRIEAINKLKTN